MMEANDLQLFQDLKEAGIGDSALKIKALAIASKPVNKVKGKAAEPCSTAKPTSMMSYF